MGQTCAPCTRDPTTYLALLSAPERKWGWKRDLPDNRDRILRFDLAFKAGLPSSIDLRPKEHFPIYDQGHLGSCTANALGGAFHYAQIRQGLPGFVPSRLFIYYNERSLEGSVAEDAGAYIRDGVKTMCKEGVCNEVLWPYIESQLTTKPSQAAYEMAAQNRAKEYARVPQTLDDMKATIAAGFPFAFGFVVFKSFMSQMTASTGRVTMPVLCCGCDEALGGHAVLACGYDQEREVFIVRNSWGEAWGDAGYFYLPYEYMENEELVSDLWAMKVVEGGDFPAVDPVARQARGAGCFCAPRRARVSRR